MRELEGPQRILSVAFTEAQRSDKLILVPRQAGPREGSHLGLPSPTAGSLYCIRQLGLNH